MATERNNPSRRTVLGALATTPILAGTVGTAIAAERNPDAGIIAAWEVRQRALAEIEARGTFYDAEIHSPGAADVYDEAEMRIVETEATTIRGALIQAWVVWAFVGDSLTERDARLHALIRRADFAALEREWSGLDFSHQAILQTIRSLRLLAGEA